MSVGVENCAPGSAGCRLAVVEGPRAPGAAFPARGAPGEGRAKPEPGRGGRRSLRRGHPTSSARPATAQEASGGLAVTSLWKPRYAPGRTRAPPRARAPPAPRCLARPPSIFFLLLSFSHSKIGQRMEVTPGTAPGCDAKAAFSPRLRKSIATIQFGGASRPHTAPKARRPWL